MRIPNRSPGVPACDATRVAGAALPGGIQKGPFVISVLRNTLRGLLGMKRPRALPKRSNKPAIGACIVCGDLRMTVQAGLSDELWSWLLDQGWREITYRPDRRRYRELPTAWVTRLIDTVPETRQQVLRVAAQRASLRPTVGDPSKLPSYIETR
jgi:hypothetical protein